METKLGKEERGGGKTSLATEFPPVQFRARLVVERDQKFSPETVPEF